MSNNFLHNSVRFQARLGAPSAWVRLKSTLGLTVGLESHSEYRFGEDFIELELRHQTDLDDPDARIKIFSAALIGGSNIWPVLITNHTKLRQCVLLQLDVGVFGVQSLQVYFNSSAHRASFLRWLNAWYASKDCRHQTSSDVSYLQAVMGAT